MNLLSQIIERLNQRIGAGNIFDQIYGLSELSADGNDKAWVHYIGNGQAVPVTNFDAHQATIFWAKRGKITVQKVDSIKLSGCKALYETKFTLSAYAVARKSHLPCDAADAQDWLASRVLRLVSGTDPLFKTSIGVVSYEVIPNGYANEVKSLTANYEFACVTIDVDVNVISPSEDGCYDTCGSGDIPLPDLIPCTPCLTEVAVDGITIIGNGTVADPLIAIGGGGGGGILVALPFSTDHLTSTGNPYTIGNVVWYLGNVYRCIANNDSILPTNASYWVNLGAGFQAVERPSDWNATTGNNQILNKPTIPAAQVNSDWNASSGVAEILNKPTIPVLPASIVEDVTATSPISSSGGATPDISITQADGSTDGYLSSTDWNTFNSKGNGTVTSVNSGINISVDNTNPAAPIINSLSDRYKTTSTTSNSVTNGSKNFTVDLNLSYIPLQEILIVHNPANHMHGEVTSYDAATGALVVDIKTHTGSGTYTAWTLNLDGTPVDALTGSGTANEIAYFTAARVLASLPVATYPSLTELSYVKGVGSAIQTQINAKFNTPSGTTAQYVRGDGSLATFPSLPLIYKDVNNQTAVTGVTTNTKVVGVLIPANTITVGAIVEIKARMTKPAGNGLMTLRVYANTADSIVTPAPTLLMTAASNNVNQNYTGIDRTALVKSATVTQTASATSSVLTDASTFQGVVTNSNVDWTVNKYVIFAIQNGSAADATTLSYYQIEIK